MRRQEETRKSGERDAETFHWCRCTQHTGPGDRKPLKQWTVGLQNTTVPSIMQVQHGVTGEHNWGGGSNDCMHEFLWRLIANSISIWQNL